MGDQLPAVRLPQTETRIHQIALSARRICREQWPVLTAIASYFAWYLVYSRFHPETLLDEPSHIQAILDISAGDYSLKHYLPMWPGYHWLVAILSYPVGPSLNLARAVTMLMGAVAVILYSLAFTAWRGRDARRGVLLFAWLPILFPFTALVYTDVPAVMFFAGALWAMTRQRYIQSSAWLVGAIDMRHPNIVWAAFFVAWISLDLWHEHRSELQVGRISWSTLPIRSWLQRSAGFLILLSAAVVIQLVRGSVAPRPVFGQEPDPNIAHIYLISLFVLGLWLPVWITRFRGEVAGAWAVTRRYPLRTAAEAAGLVLLGALLIRSYTNAHPYNQGRVLAVRNTPITYMQEELWVRVLGVACFFIAAWLLIGFWRAQPERRYLVLVAFFSLLFIAPHGLIEPRYYLAPFILAGFFTVFTRRQATWLIAWYGLISLTMCIVIVKTSWIW